MDVTIQQIAEHYYLIKPQDIGANSKARLIAYARKQGWHITQIIPLKPELKCKVWNPFES